MPSKSAPKAPAKTKQGPARTKAAPARTKAAPARTKAAPARTKAAPARTKAAPASPVKKQAVTSRTKYRSAGQKSKRQSSALGKRKISDYVDNDDVCSICMDPLGVKDLCYACSNSHLFHCKCINKARDKHGFRSCPLCRQPLEIRNADPKAEKLITFSKKVRNALKQICNSSNVSQLQTLENHLEEFKNSSSKKDKKWFAKQPFLFECDFNKDNAPAVVELLLKYGADPNILHKVYDYSDTSFTPLILAAQMGNIEVANILLDYNADIDKANNDGDRPLTEAIYSSKIGVLKVLLERGADPHMANKLGNTPIKIAENVRKFLTQKTDIEINKKIIEEINKYL